MKIPITVTEGVLRALKALRLYSGMNGTTARYKPGDELWLDSAAQIEPYVSFAAGKQLCSMGAFSYSWSELDTLQQVGRYCSIAHSVSNFSVKHRMDDVSTSSYPNLASEVFQQAVLDRLGTVTDDYSIWPHDSGPHVPARIGHDVWIGEGALLARNISIGHGAVIGARSVVTKDVPPYAVVAGSPARLIRYRFDEALVEQLLASQWWRFHFADFQQLGAREPERFVARLQEAAAQGQLLPFETDPRPFARRLQEQLIAQGDTPAPLLDDLARRLVRAQLQQDFEVPSHCPQWHSAEPDTRDGAPMRFFAQHAWLDLVLAPDTTAVEFTVHHAVTARAEQTFGASIQGVALQRQDAGRDKQGRRCWRFVLPPGGCGGAVRLALHCAVSTRPHLLFAGRDDSRILSVAVSPPRLVNGGQRHAGTDAERAEQAAEPLELAG